MARAMDRRTMGHATPPLQKRNPEKRNPEKRNPEKRNPAAKAAAGPGQVRRISKRSLFVPDIGHDTRQPAGVVPTVQEETSMPVSPVPGGYHSVTPYLIVNDTSRALSSYAE